MYLQYQLVICFSHQQWRIFPMHFYCKPMNLLMVPDMCAWGTLGCSEQKGVLRNRELHSKWSLREFRWRPVHNAGHGTHVCTSAKTPVVASKGANLVQSWRNRWMKAYVSKPWKTLAFAKALAAKQNDNWSRVERKQWSHLPSSLKIGVSERYPLTWYMSQMPSKKTSVQHLLLAMDAIPGHWVFIVFHDTDSGQRATFQTATLWMLAWYSSMLYPTAGWFGRNMRST